MSGLAVAARRRVSPGSSPSSRSPAADAPECRYPDQIAGVRSRAGQRTPTSGFAERGHVEDQPSQRSDDVSTCDRHPEPPCERTQPSVRA